MKRTLALLLALVFCLSLCACGGGDAPAGDASTDGAPADEAPAEGEVNVPNNGEWDEVLCSGDGYHIDKKEVDAYDGYKIMLGVVNDQGEWVQSLAESGGTFIDQVKSRASSSTSPTLADSSCYMYLGEGVFLASPGVSVYTEDAEYRVGPWPNSLQQGYTGSYYTLTVWECLLWNVTDNSQWRFDANKITTVRDGYLLYCAEDADIAGPAGGAIYASDTHGKRSALPCRFEYYKPKHRFPVYSEGLFYACTEERKKPGFFDIEGNLVIDLSDYEMARVPFSSVLGLNAPYFENGQATFLFRNNAGSIFKGTIDKTGTFVREPEKTDLKAS